MKKNTKIRAVKRKDVPSKKGYTDALCKLKIGGDGVFLPTSASTACVLGYHAAAHLSGIRFTVRSVDGGVVVTREA